MNRIFQRTKKVRPEKIRLEASSYCQLRCPLCPTTTKTIEPNIGRGFLQFSDFKILVDKNKWIKEIELSNYGEIFLNPDLLEILKYAYDKNVALTADNGVNLNFIKNDVLEGLVKYQVRKLNCSIDGASNKTYQTYRIRGDFENVINNIRTINEYKDQYDSEFPELAWQFIVFGHNEHEIPLARKMAEELKMTFTLKLSWDNNFSPIQNLELVRNEVGAATREEHFEIHGIDYMQSICHQLWDLPQINWDGKNLGCCRNFWGDFGGNAFNDGLDVCLNNEKMDYAKGMLLGQKEARNDIPCTTCNIFISMRSEQKWLERK